ncbi:hypothetical protein A8B78_19875 [Jannaschia sp. EhC01]|nr:hypothetical protein A8B78_19875 [Jannaschia sp. EhC01]
MAHEADLREPDSEPPRLDRALRVLEAILFCCLSTLVLFWIADRMRGVDFDPIVVTPCIGAACVPYVGPHAGSPWSVYTQGLEPREATSFSATNMCTQLADTLQLRGTEAEGVDLIVDLMTSRGTVTVSNLDEATVRIAPGPRNDGFFDVIRDGLSWTPTRGCHPINYKPVFWPLWFSWTLLAFLRLFRGRQQEWARR